MQDVKKVKQLVVVVEDRPGMLSEVTEALGRDKINLDAICAFSMDGKAVFNIICSDNQKAKAGLVQKGWQVKEEEVVALNLENKPGALNEVAARLKAKNVNLIYCYGSACDCSCGCGLFFKAQDNDKAVEALK